MVNSEMDDNRRSTIEPIPEDDEKFHTTELGQILLPSSSASQQITEPTRLLWSVDGEALVWLRECRRTR